MVAALFGLGLCPGLTACLAFADYELTPEADSEPSEAPSEPAPQACSAGEYSCVTKQLRRCDDGNWAPLQQCEEAQFCSSELGACLTCEPDTTTACEGNVLMRCAMDGLGFEPAEDCGQLGLICDTQLSPEACIECRPTDRRCDGNVLLHCPDLTFGEGRPCAEPSQCQSVDGRSDYCTECSEPGQEACGLRQRVQCSEELKFELLEECPNGCVAAGDSTRCESEAP